MKTVLTSIAILIGFGGGMALLEHPQLLTYLFAAYFGVVAIWGLVEHRNTALLLFGAGVANILLLHVNAELLWSYGNGVMVPMYGATIDGLIAILILLVGDSWRVRNGSLLFAAMAVNFVWLWQLGLGINTYTDTIYRALVVITIAQMAGCWRGILGPTLCLRRFYLDRLARIRCAATYRQTVE